MSGVGVVLSRFKASPVQLYLPTGTELGNKNIQTNNFLIRGTIPTTTPMGNRVIFASTPVGNRASTLNHYFSVKLGCMPNFRLLGYVKVGFQYFPGRWLRSLCVTGCAAYESGVGEV